MHTNIHFLFLVIYYCICANRAAVAVGRTAMSSAEMIKAGMRGKGVIVLHTYCDHLW